MPTKRRLLANLIGLALSLAAASLATEALAAPPRDADSPGLHASEVGAEASYSSSSAFGTSLSLVPWVRYAIPRSNIELDVEVPLTVAWKTFALGNPGLGAHVDLPLAHGAAVRLGAAVHLPGASLGESFATGYALSLATVSRGFLDIDRWAPNFVPVTAPVELELQPVRHLFVRALVETQALVPILENAEIPTAKDLILLERGRIEIEGRSRWGIGGGLDVDAIGALTDTPFVDDDRLEVSIEPYLQFANESFFVRAGVLVPLSAPLGVFGNSHPGSGVAPVATTTARFGLVLDGLDAK